MRKTTKQLPAHAAPSYVFLFKRIDALTKVLSWLFLLKYVSYRPKVWQYVLMEKKFWCGDERICQTIGFEFRKRTNYPYLTMSYQSYNFLDHWQIQGKLHQCSRIIVNSSNEWQCDELHNCQNVECTISGLSISDDDLVGHSADIPMMLICCCHPPIENDERIVPPQPMTYGTQSAQCIRESMLLPFESIAIVSSKNT